MQSFEPRRIRFCGVIALGDFRLKRYEVTRFGHPEAHDCRAHFVSVRGAVPGLLPEPARTAARPGVGVLIEHCGAGADYLVVGWWDRENELPIRILVREQKPSAEWRAAGPTESFCVWDLQVIGFERDAYVRTILAPGADEASVDRYLAAAYSSPE
jgi:hypothetical protein